VLNIHFHHLRKVCHQEVLWRGGLRAVNVRILPRSPSKLPLRKLNSLSSTNARRTAAQRPSAAHRSIPSQQPDEGAVRLAQCPLAQLLNLVQNGCRAGAALRAGRGNEDDWADTAIVHLRPTILKSNLMVVFS
jgi:hypothetical protein